MAAYSEQRDATGRVTIEVKDTQVWWLFTYAGVIVMLFLGFEVVLQGDFPLKWQILIAAGIALAGVAHYLFTRKVLTVRLDPKARTLSVSVDGRARVLPYAEVQSASIDSEERTSGNTVYAVRRLDLVLRSGERVMVPEGFGTFREETCEKLLTRINGALRH